MLDKYDLTKEENISLAEYMLVFIIYNSAKLEGINVNNQDTKTILDGANVPSLRLDEINCILNLRDAWNFVLSSIDEPITLELICKINAFVSRGESLEWGVLRTGKVGINGVDYIPDIPDETKIIADIKNIMKEEYFKEFNSLLTEYYNTNKMESLLEFLYNNCIFGMEV